MSLAVARSAAGGDPARVASVRGVYAALRAQRNFKLDGAKTGHDARAARRRADDAREPALRRRLEPRAHRPARRRGPAPN